MTSFIKKYFHKLVAWLLTKETKKLLKKTPQLKVVAITGSVGKTTSKHAIAHVLMKKYKVRFHPGNYNTDIGMPLSIFGLTQPDKLLQPIVWFKIWRNARRQARVPFPFDVLVLELGADQAGEIGYFMEFLNPDIGVVTAIQPAHLGGFKTIETTQNEKLKLAAGSKLALLNQDDVLIMEKRSTLSTKSLTFGLNEADYWFEESSFDEKKGFTGTLHMADRSFPVTVPFIARHLIRSAVAGAAAGNLMGIPDEEIAEALESLRNVDGRMNPLPGKSGSFLIDDSYNASPGGVIAALDTLYSLSGRRIAVLGTMNELGPTSPEFHRTVGEYCKKLDYLITIGEEAKVHLAQAAIEAGLNADRVKSFLSPFEAGDYLAANLSAGDKVLVKGSQNKVFAEETTKKLLANPADAERLVRQGKRWLEIKAKTFTS